MRRFFGIIYGMAIAASALNVAPAIAEENYPDKTVRVVVGMAPGGANDTVARLISSELSERLGQTFVVENKPGANSTIATSGVKRAKPDGHNLMLVISSHVTNTLVYPNLTYDIDDFEPVSVIADTPFVLVANPNFVPNNIAELIDFAKSSKEPIDFGTPGLGSTQHISMELMNQMAGIEMTHIPYGGGALAQTDLISGVIPLIFATPTQSLPFIQTDQLKALGVTSKERIPQLPEVPTLDESGLAGYEANVWFGIVAPKNTPDSIVQKLNTEIAAIVHSDKVRKQLFDMGLNPVGSTVQEFEALLAQEQSKWSDVIEKSNIKLQ